MNKQNQICTNLTAQKTTLAQIEDSMKLMQSRIQHLLKQQQKNRKKLNCVFQDSLQVIENKLNHSQSETVLKHIVKKKGQQVSSLQDKIKIWKQKQHTEMETVKKSIDEIKKQESENIRQMSKRHQALIQQNRKNNYQKKRLVYTKLKEEKEQSKIFAVKYLQEKKAQLTKLKQAEKVRNEEKKLQMLEQLKKMQKSEMQLIEKIKNTTDIVHNLENISKATNCLKNEEFQKIVQEINKSEKPSNRTQFKQKILEQILKNKNNPTH